MKIKDDKVIFSTGKEKYANNGIIGLSPELDITEGYDGGFEEDEDDLTKEEQIELAEYMIEAWARFKEKAS